MANNTFPPGMPFPFPFPQMQQPPNGAHQDGQQQQQQQQHAPPPPPGWNLPGLQQHYPPQPYAPQPGHAENQSSLPQFPSAAVGWPPQIPPEWLQLMQSGMQSGMIPPPLPGLSFPPPSLPHTPQAPATPTALPPQFHRPPAAAPVERVHEVMDSDREDGEVSDASRGSRTAAGIAMRQRYLDPARSAPHPTSTPSQAEHAYNPDKPSAGQTMPQVPTPKAAPQPVVDEMTRVQQQRDEAKQFIRLLNSNNIGYHALAKENIDVELLRAMYRSMNLPSEPEPIPPPKTNGAAGPKPSSDSQAPAASSASQKTALAASAASAAALPVDRKDYLARLQAAKLARQAVPAKTSPPQKSPPVAVASPAAGTSTPQATMTPTKKPPATDEQKARQTELIKQRLEALKAQSKQTAASSGNAPQKNASSQPTAQQAPATGTSAPQTPASGFAGIPGLFMSGPSNSGIGNSTPSRQQHSVPLKRPAPSDTSLSTPRGSVTPYSRPSGQSPRAHQEDSMIIEVSDDESNGSDMDIDDDQAPSSSAIRQAPVSIPGFPPRQAPVPTTSSAVSTPGPQTPSTLARTGELSSKEQELAALKLTLKKKLAEQKRIKEAAEAAAAAASVAQASSKPGPASSAPIHTSTQSQAGSHSQQATTVTHNHSTASVSDSSRDRKRRRRTEIQEQLPSLDDEIASNEAEMARLAKDLERLKANNERIMQDKQRLTKELEDLGIDTEGMSHADMRATKDEIERAMSPEVDAVPQIDNTIAGAKPLTDVSSAPAAAGGNDTVPKKTANLPDPTPVGAQPNQANFGYLPGLGQVASDATVATVPRSTPKFTQEQHVNASHDLQAASEIREPVGAPNHGVNVSDHNPATPMDDDDEDFYSPPPPAAGTVNVDSTVADVVQPQSKENIVNAPSPSEEGELDMSESSDEGDDEEEYEPEEPFVENSVVDDSVTEIPAVDERVAELSQQAQLSDLQTQQSQSVGQSQVSTEDEEAYEPPDVDEEMAEVVPVPGATQPEASSPHDADDGAMDIATSSSEDSDDSDMDSDEDTQSELGASASQTHAAQQMTNIADDLAPELQPQASIVTVPNVEQTEEPHIEEEPEPARFTPYESPLRMFKSYRYHPNFSQDVDGGFLSMTYSHQIDPEKPLCPFESAGGSCNDPECPNQHFRGMGITGEKLLVQLGTANPGKTQDEKQQWNDGLRSVLKELRQKNIKDPNGIAQEIAKYRRQFLNDDTRVVNL